MNITTAIAIGYIKLSRPFNRRGLYSVMRRVNNIFRNSAERPHTVDLPCGSKFTFPAGDPYWHSVFSIGRNYEPEIAHLLKLTRPSLFIDCGANFGYWSVVASRCMPTVAIEASTQTFGWLSQNAIQNESRFHAINAAITDGGTGFVKFSVGGDHAGRSVSEHGERIPAVSIDGIVAQYRKGDGPIVVKLDVEGVEIQALAGATETMKGNSFIVYEDHGKDTDCETTAHLLSFGQRIVFLTEGGRIVPIHSVSDAVAVKPLRFKGYNFIALGDKASI